MSRSNPSIRVGCRAEVERVMDCCEHRVMTAERLVVLSIEAGAAVRQILGIMIDQTMADNGWDWDLEHVVTLDTRLEQLWAPEVWSALDGEERSVELGIDDVGLVLDGMAYTEIASAEFPWIEMVRWTADFVTAELRAHWTDDEWRAFGARGRPGS